MSDDGVNFVIYEKRGLPPEDATKARSMKLIDVVKQLQPEGTLQEKTDAQGTVVIIRNTTNFSAARIKRVLYEWFVVESFINDHPRVNGVNNKSPRGY